MVSTLGFACSSGRGGCWGWDLRAEWYLTGRGMTERCLQSASTHGIFDTTPEIDQRLNDAGERSSRWQETALGV
jgi:hypothetical protein